MVNPGIVATTLLRSAAVALPRPPANARSTAMQARAQETPATETSTNGPADRSAPRTDQNSMTAHAQLLEKAKQALGPPGTTDLAPPPTGDPSAARRPP